MRIREWIHRLVGIVRRSRGDDELQEELRAHIALAEERGYRATGASQAMEALRDQRGLPWLDDFVRDVRHALRTLRRAPAFTAVATLTLALGIGANLAIFSVIDALLVRQLPIDKPGELVSLAAHRPGQPEPSETFTNPLWETIRDEQDVFAGVFAWSSPEPFDFSEGAIVQTVDGLMVSGGYFDTLRIAPAAGRLIAAGDDRRGCPAVAVLSHGFWQAQFGASRDIVGRTIALFRQPFQVIGVSAPEFHGLEVSKKFDVAVPICASAAFDKRNIESRGRWWLSVAGRLPSGMTEDQLKVRLDALAPRVMRAVVPAAAANREQLLQTRFVTAPAATGFSPMRRTFGEPLKLLMGAVAIVLLIACANIASLLLAKATTRAREIAVRTALGASRRRLIRQLVTESLILSSLGAALGLLLATWGSELLVRSLATVGNRVFVDVSPGGRLLGFTAGIAVVTGVLVGLLPAIRATSVSLISAMKTRETAGSAPQVRFHAGKWIVGAQVALSLVLLIGGGLLLRTFVKLATLDTGFDRRNVLVVTATPPWFAADTAAMNPEQRSAAYDEVIRRLREMPGVISVARSFMAPIGDNNWSNAVSTDVANAPTGGGGATAYFNLITPAYFETLRTPLVSGRGFDRRDTKQSPQVAIVNESAARKFFPGVNPLGRRLLMGGRLPAPLEVVGIVKDAKYQSLREGMPPTIYLPAVQAPPTAGAEVFLVRTASSPVTLIPVVERTVREAAGAIPLRFRTLEEQVADNLAQDRLLATLAGLFGAMALLLAMIGLYGVLSYLVTHRQAEFGIRMALGAEPASIRQLVMKDVGTVLVAGLAVGLTGSLASVRLLQGMLFELEPRDPVTMVAAVCLLTAMALLAGYLPARRATRVDPIVALRSE